jgi:para-aminobenzoate synthetase/4-amino-4-deoxychorismate lyase
MLVLIDFPDADGRNERLNFTDPLEIISADTIDDVRASLDRVERHASAGRFAIGFVAYDAAPAFDSALRVGEQAPTPLLWFGIYDAPAEPLESRAAHLLDASEWRPHVGRAQYENAIDGIRSEIADGAFYQVNHTVRLRAGCTGDSLAAYEALRAAQPSSYGMYLDIGRFQFLSVSPELFFSRTDSRIQTRPMKGTARRGRWPDEDARAAAALVESIKDRAENVMIVDLVRNDIGRIAELGTVAVPRLFEVERHPTLWQMTSTITADLRANVRLYDIFAALFPCGSVVGAPKIAAASWIADHEAAPRGIYCGAMGIVRPGGDCVFNVAIRTLVIDSETEVAEYGAGGGITIDSTSSGEYDELLAKAAVLRGAEPEFQLIETLRLSNGAYVRRHGHVSRLLASADYFDFRDVAQQSVDTALDEFARIKPAGDHRVRLLLSRDGAVKIEATPIAPLGTERRTPLRYAVSQSPISSRDVFLFHKTTHRAAYNERRAAYPDAGEVILLNERGELTECSVGNLVLEIGGQRFTPPRDCGLLAGIYREDLLGQGLISERVLYPADLASATRVWLINSLREWIELTL